jgi:uncharacterized protein YdaU (DUF1376 family)
MKHFYFAFYPKDFIAATVGMKAEEVGAYIRLLCYQFDNEAIPIDDIETLSIIAGTDNLNKVLLKFPCGINKKLSRVKEQGEYLSAIREEAGSKGGSKTQAKLKQKSSNGGNINIKTKIKTELDTKLNSESEHTDVACVFDFDEVWSLYPNKDGRKAAERSFKASVKTPKDFEDIKVALQNYLTSDKVQRGYVKNGSTWFNNWRDFIDYKPMTAGTRTLAAAANLHQALERSITQ